MIACSAVHINEITCSGEEGPKTYLRSHKAQCRTVAQEGLMYSSNQLATVHTLSTLFAPNFAILGFAAQADACQVLEHSSAQSDVRSTATSLSKHAALSVHRFFEP